MEEKTPLAVQVDNLAKHCLFKPEEMPPQKGTEETILPEDAIVVQGITATYGFHPGRIMEKKNELRAILDQMPDKFHERGPGSDGGASFLELCETKAGEQWTGLHKLMEVLCCLAIASGLGRWCMPRLFWGTFPGGMPYITLDTRR